MPDEVRRVQEGPVAHRAAHGMLLALLSPGLVHLDGGGVRRRWRLLRLRLLLWTGVPWRKAILDVEGLWLLLLLL